MTEQIPSLLAKFREKLEKYGIKYEEEDGEIVVSLDPRYSPSIDITIDPYEIKIDSVAYYEDGGETPAGLCIMEREGLSRDVVKYDRDVLKKLYLTLKAILEALGELEESEQTNKELLKSIIELWIKGWLCGKYAVGDYKIRVLDDGVILVDLCTNEFEDWVINEVMDVLKNLGYKKVRWSYKYGKIHLEFWNFD